MLSKWRLAALGILDGDFEMHDLPRWGHGSGKHAPCQEKGLEFDK